MHLGCFQALFSPLVNNNWQYCVSIWIQEGWIEWLATPLENSPAKNIIFGQTNENHGMQFQPFEANQPLSFLNRHALGH